MHLWGTDFRRSSSALRSRLFVCEEKRRKALEGLLALGFKDLVYLHTCNRVEFYTTSENHFADSRYLFQKALKALGAQDGDFYQGYHLEGKSALRHLLRISGSLESLVVGEPQILGQLKEAIAWTKESGLPLTATLDGVFQLAFETAKRIRTETTIGHKSVSVASMSIQRCTQWEKQFPLQRVAVVGRSPMSLGILRWLQETHPKCEVVWVNRDVEKLDSFSERQFTSPMKLSDFLSSPPSFSHMFTATSSSNPLFDDSFFEAASDKPLLVFDLAHPADVSLENVKHVKLIQMEDLQQEAKANENAREHEMREAEAIIEAMMREYYLSKKETPVLRDFSQIEKQLIETLKQSLVSIEHWISNERLPKLHLWAEKLVKKNLHLSREHLRQVLRKAAQMDKTPTQPM